MTAVIFGGSGFIGRHLARWLAERDDEVLIADIEPPTFELPAGVRFERCDVREPIGLDVGAQPVVYNLAAVHRSPGHADHEYFDTNVPGARNVTDFCTRAGTQRLFFTSSISVYGPSEEPLSESSPTRATTTYGRSKIEAEWLHEQWAREAPGRRLVIVRPASIFGAGEEGNFTRLARAIARHRFVYPGRRDTRKACGYVLDLVESLAFAESLASPTVTYNFCFPAPPTSEQVCAAIATIGGFSTPSLTIPIAFVRLASRLLVAVGASTYDEERVLKLTRSTNIVPAVLLDNGFEFQFSLESALADWYASAGRFA